MGWVVLLAQLATWEVVKPPVLHKGTWQTCQGEERVLEHRVNGRLLWALHMGPSDEFALYAPADDPDGEHTHDSLTNRLKPSYHVSDVSTWRGARQWTDAGLGLWVSVVRAGEPDEGCDSFYVEVRTQR